MPDEKFQPCPHGQFLSNRLDRTEVDVHEALECHKALKVQMIRVESKVEHMEERDRKYDLADMAADIKHIKDEFEYFKNECQSITKTREGRSWDMKLALFGIFLNMIATAVLSLYFANAINPL
jgi:hypothetical protein